jgi:hypothetical protein
MVESVRYGTGNNESRGYFYRMFKSGGKEGSGTRFLGWNGRMWNRGNDCDSRRDAEK